MHLRWPTMTSRAHTAAHTLQAGIPDLSRRPGKATGTPGLDVNFHLDGLAVLEPASDDAELLFHHAEFVLEALDEAPHRHVARRCARVPRLVLVIVRDLFNEKEKNEKLCSFV
jgi:hypothetical protein